MDKGSQQHVITLCILTCLCTL